MNDQTYLHCPPVSNCQDYIVKRGDTLFQIAKRHDLTVNEIVVANPQITNPDLIYPGQQICIPLGPDGPGGPGMPDGQLEALSMGFYSPDGMLLPQDNGVAILAPVTIVRVTFSGPVSHGYLFFTPSGTETFLYTQLIGLTISDGSPMLQFEWQVPPAMLGTVFVIGCNGQICTQTEPINVYSPES